MKHAILGAGGVGGLVGATLAHEGDQVTLLLRPETPARHPGYLRLEGPTGNIEAPVRTDTELREPVDVLWITVKAYQLVEALRAVPRNGPGIVTIVPLLNGIDHVALLRSRFDPKRVVPGTIAVESERIAPGHIIQRSPFARLEFSATGEGQLEGVAARLRRAGLSCEFQIDEKTMLWSKLAFLAPFALTDLRRPGMAGTARIGGRRGLRCCGRGRGDCRSAKNPDDHRIFTSNDAQLDAKRRVGWPHARARRDRRPDHSGGKDPRNRRHRDTATSRNNRRPAGQIASRRDTRQLRQHLRCTREARPSGSNGSIGQEANRRVFRDSVFNR